LALSLALSVGLAPTRFPDGGETMWVTRLVGIAAGVAVGAILGLVIGSCVPVDPATRTD
jgi:hypothetical protein